MFVLPGEDAGSLEQADVAIVGAGVAGITLARALDDGKRRILLIESGDFELSDKAQSLFRASIAGLPVDTMGSRYRAFGGSSYMWTGRTAPLDPLDLERRSWVPDSGWPIAFDELREPYRRAMRACGFAEGWEAPPAQLAAIEALPRRPEGLAPHVWRFWAMSREAFQHWGDDAYEHVRGSQNLHALLGADLVGLEADGEGAVRAARLLRGDGSRLMVRAGAFVLCCGGIENARLLLNFAEQEPALLGRVAPVAGRYFMQHPRAPTVTVNADARAGARLQAMFNRFMRPHGLQYETGFALTAEVQQRLELVNASAVLRYSRRAPDGIASIPFEIGRAAQSVVRKVRGHEAALGALTATLVVDLEQVPDRESRILLSDERDALGLRAATIDWRVNEPEQRSAAWISRAVAGWIGSLGLGQPMLVEGAAEHGGLIAGQMLESYHHLGATRMSESAATGVVDANLRVHGVRNLFVCGGSVMPTGGHANSTLTIAALSLRLGDHLARQLNKPAIVSG